ncbi:MAG: helix-turn-helix transcriptional regulator [Myxococcota bacterium]|nr:helix-turn-helix transcriptional regulator [Myxococcota bacterium]
MNPEQRAIELVDLTYRAATDPEAWRPVAKALSELFGGAALILDIQAPGLGQPDGEFHVGLDRDLMREARSSWKEGLAWMTAAGNDLGKRFIRVSDYYTQQDLAESKFVREFLIPQGLAPEWPIVHIISPEEAVLSSGISVCRRKGGSPVTEEQLGVADRLVPHLKRAIAISSRLANVANQQVALHEVIDRIPTGVIILDTSCRPLFVNRMATRILKLEDGLTIDERGPRGKDQTSTAQLRSLIDSAVNPLPGHELAGGGFMGLPRSSGLRAFPLLITPILGHTNRGTIADGAAVMFVSDPDCRDVSFATVLSEVYGLTPAESELAQLLAQGRSLEEAATARHVTLNTARSQLKQVFAKTDTNRQGELLQLVLSGVTVIDRPPDADAEETASDKTAPAAVLPTGSN